MKIYLICLCLLIAIHNLVHAGLYKAAFSSDQQAFYDLLTTGADINRGCPLHRAICDGQKEIITWLLQARKIFANAKVDVNLQNHEGQTPLHMACCFGDYDIACMLVDAGADIEATNNRGQTPLHVASLWGQKYIVLFLLALNANIEAKDRFWGHRPLHLAVYIKTPSNLQCVKKLLEAGAKIMARNRSGETPLHIACTKGFGGAIAELLKAGADTNIQDMYGETPLHKIALKNFKEETKRLLEGENPVQDFVELTALLVEAHANPNIGDASGFRPLHCAAYRANIAIVLKLLQVGANVSLKTRKLKTKKTLTAIMAAEAVGENETAQVIRDFISGKEVGALSRAFYDPLSATNRLPLNIYQEIYEQLRLLPRE